MTDRGNDAPATNAELSAATWGMAATFAATRPLSGYARRFRTNNRLSESTRRISNQDAMYSDCDDDDDKPLPPPTPHAAWTTFFPRVGNADDKNCSDSNGATTKNETTGGPRAACVNLPVVSHIRTLLWVAGYNATIVGKVIAQHQGRVHVARAAQTDGFDRTAIGLPFKLAAVMQLARDANERSETHSVEKKGTVGRKVFTAGELHDIAVPVLELNEALWTARAIATELSLAQHQLDMDLAAITCLEVYLDSGSNIKALLPDKLPTSPVARATADYNTVIATDKRFLEWLFWLDDDLLLTAVWCRHGHVQQQMMERTREWRSVIHLEYIAKTMHTQEKRPAVAFKDLVVELQRRFHGRSGQLGVKYGRFEDPGHGPSSDLSFKSVLESVRKYCFGEQSTVSERTLADLVSRLSLIDGKVLVRLCDEELEERFPTPPLQRIEQHDKCVEYVLATDNAMISAVHAFEAHAFYDTCVAQDYVQLDKVPSGEFV